MAQSTTTLGPPAYSDINGPSPGTSTYLDVAPTMQQDPRLSSTHSLAPEERGDGDGRRKLLLVYVHGFMGDESSFRNFPAHVHNLATVLLAGRYVVHSKVYPRYKSRRALDVVAEDFSAWLAPHESPTTDVVLLGHSMGGLLASEVVLLRPRPPGDGRALRHRILGVVNFDVPFLGMHPGVIATGLASIFAPAAPLPQDAASSQSSLAPDADASAAAALDDELFGPPPTADARFNAPYANDVRLAPPRKGWRSALHFLQKHADDGLRRAAAQYVRSHAEFGGAMADYRGLRARYLRVRALEEDEEGVRGGAARVRFVNYYTACFGKAKKDKADGGTAASSTGSLGGGASSQDLGDGAASEAATLEPERDGAEQREPEAGDLGLVDSEITVAVSASSSSDGGASALVWPPLSPLPPEPTAPDYAAYVDKVVQDALRKEHERRVKAHKQAVKDREVTLAERKKAEEKIHKAATKVAAKMAVREKEKAEKGVLLVQSTEHDAAAADDGSLSAQRGRAELEHGPRTASPSPSGQPKKERRFCVIPPRDDAGTRDPTWIRVFIEDVDEVTAHMSLFIVSEAYERLVGDVGARIEEWIGESGR